jgi:hypothetical protein
MPPQVVGNAAMPQVVGNAAMPQVVGNAEGVARR